MDWDSSAVVRLVVVSLRLEGADGSVLLPLADEAVPTFASPSTISLSPEVFVRINIPGSITSLH